MVKSMNRAADPTAVYALDHGTLRAGRLDLDVYGDFAPTFPSHDRQDVLQGRDWHAIRNGIAAESLPGQVSYPGARSAKRGCRQESVMVYHQHTVNRQMHVQFDTVRSLHDRMSEAGK